jgi:hypothetical protein
MRFVFEVKSHLLRTEKDQRLIVMFFHGALTSIMMVVLTVLDERQQSLLLNISHTVDQLLEDLNKYFLFKEKDHFNIFL